MDINYLIKKEEKRKKESLELIPSENNVSPNVRKCLGSILTTKYAEGYPGKRYYGGNQFIDEIEREAQERIKKLFKVHSVNVQPYSGSPANQAVYLGLLNPGDKVMGLSLTSGGHLTHGWKVNFSGRLYNTVFYNLNRKGEIDYAEVKRIAKKEKPRLLWMGATAYPLIIDWAKLDGLAEYTAADISHIAGLVVAGIHPSPVDHADIITSTTHKTFRGPRGGLIMCTERGKDLEKKINKAVFPGLQGGPHINQIAALAEAAQEASTASFRCYARQIVKNASVLSKELIKKGFTLVSGRTENHLMVVHLKGMSGQEAQDLLEAQNIITNKNTVPFDTASPMNPSGLRLGTPLVTTRGMKEKEMKMIASWIDRALKKENIKKEVVAFARKFPLYDN
jgi:glycine hydroxymethyltransferase